MCCDQGFSRPRMARSEPMAARRSFPRPGADRTESHQMRRAPCRHGRHLRRVFWAARQQQPNQHRNRSHKPVCVPGRFAAFLPDASRASDSPAAVAVMNLAPSAPARRRTCRATLSADCISERSMTTDLPARVDAAVRQDRSNSSASAPPKSPMSRNRTASTSSCK